MTSNEKDSVMTSPSSPSASNVSVTQASTSEIIVIKGRRFRQRPLGPAPFASFEDLSDELDSPPETARVILPGIKEDPSSQLQSPSTPLPQGTGITLTEKEEQGLKDALKSSLIASAPPRIDISRASSSSQHEDSITSSPDRENETHNLGYKEDGTVDLRSSTEELDYIQEPGTVEESEEKRKRERVLKRQQQVRNFGETQSQHELMERKDSSCSVMSDVGLLCISGRTSRLSSIGSAASGGSIASGVSHLSTGSHISGRSTRSPSPHKMLLETSFCGSKPVHSQGLEVTASVTIEKGQLTEKSGSRPPSSLRSRSPSPHKMLLETSFCGTKQILTVNNQENIHTPQKTPKHRKPKGSSTVVTEAEIVEQKTQVLQQPMPSLDANALEEEKKMEKVEKSKPEKSAQIKTQNDTILGAGKTKIIVLPKLEKKTTKPKKVISLRDLPVDEIYIPLKGPELDFEEIIRNASPNPKKSTEKRIASETANEIFIPLRSPTKTEVDDIKKCFSSESLTKVQPKKLPLKSINDRPEGKIKRETTKTRQYEVCEDGSIIIPLHSPDEYKGSKEFEKDDEDLNVCENMSEWKAKDEKQSKPATLDLSEPGLNTTTWLSQTHGKSEIITGGSRTPSPGSSVSRKSSFANMFRKSEVFGSPDSLGGAPRKKSGTFTNMLKDASEGLRDRSQSRSKSKDRQSVSSASCSPSGKKNVFTNLFGKKKTETKTLSGKESNDLRLDLQFTFNPGMESIKKTSDEGDYIIIPLRDPSDPPASLGIDEESSKTSGTADREVSPTIIFEKSDSPKVLEGKEQLKSTSNESVSESKNQTFVEDVVGSRKASSDGTIIKPSSEMCSDEFTVKLQNSSYIKKDSLSFGAYPKEEEEPELSRKSMKPSSSKSSEIGGAHEIGDGVQEKDCVEDICRVFPGEKSFTEKSLHLEKILNEDECVTKEEVVAVSADGIRKLKLPPEPGDLEEDHERKGLVYQESFEDELPYVPTTLPQERSLGVPIIPVKQRMSEIKTCPIERPRSTTPINPTTLEDFVSSGKEVVPVLSEEVKMKISLPRDDSITSKNKSPRRFSAKGKSWFEFAEEGLQSPREQRKSSLRTSPSPPPLPPRSSPPSVLSTSAPSTTTSWINFEELPEKRKQPKRITTVPTLRSSEDGGNISDKTGSSGTGNVVYNYVSPEDCQCECHEHNSSHPIEEAEAKEARNPRTPRTLSSKEHKHKRMKYKLPPQLEVNCECVKTPHADKSITDMSQGDSEKSECKYCEIGKHSDVERDAEERPLLEPNSEGENDDSSSRKDDDDKAGEVEDQDWTIRFSSEMKRDKSSHLSDSSGEFVSHEAENLHNSTLEPLSTKPFSMDLHMGSNRSSLASQDDLNSPEGHTNNAC